MSDDEALSGAADNGEPQKPRRRRLLVGSAASLVGALVLGAAAGGWWLANATLVASHEGAPASPTASPDLSDTQTLMPDVRGLDEATAKQVLADSAIPVNAISTHDAPSVARPGVVVEQSPAFGASNVVEVDLGVAVPVTMPDLVSETQDEAVGVLSGFGAGVTVTYAYSKEATAGTVISVDPEIGEPLGQTASVVVATAGSTLPLTQVRAIEGGCGSDQNVSIDGRDYSTALACTTSTTQPSETTWMLSKSVDRFTASIGIADDGSPGSKATYEVLLDGKVVAKGTAAFGGASSIDVPCTGTIQLMIRLGTTPDERVSVAFGDAIVYGSDDGISRLAQLR